MIYLTSEVSGMYPLRDVKDILQRMVRILDRYQNFHSDIEYYLSVKSQIIRDLESQILQNQALASEFRVI